MRRTSERGRFGIDSCVECTNQMNIEAIQTFLEAVERGSFAAVARARRIAPSSVSRVVAELEAELEVRLFQRTTRRLSLTEAGRAYVDRVGPLLEELRQAREYARDLSSAPRGLLRVAVTSAFAQVHVAKWLPRLLIQHPDLQVELVLDARYTDLISDHIDVAIRLGQVPPSSAIAKKLCAMPRMVVASPARHKPTSRLKPDSMKDEPCLLFPYEGYSPVWKFRDRRQRIREVQPRGRVIAPDGMVLRSLALQGEGYALLPRWLCAEDVASGALVDVFPEHDVTATEFDAAVYLMYASRNYLPLKVKTFVAFVTELFRNGPRWESANLI